MGATDFSSSIVLAQALLAAVTLAFGAAFFGLWLTYRRDAMRASALTWLGLGGYSALTAATELGDHPLLPLAPWAFTTLEYVTAVVAGFTAMAVVSVAYAVVAPTRRRRTLGVIAAVLSVLLCVTVAADVEFERVSRIVVLVALGWALVFAIGAAPSPGRQSMVAALGLLILRPVFAIVAVSPDAATQPAWYTALQITVTILAGFFTTTAVFHIEREASLRERLALEHSLAHAQRMDSLGRMAASVAHDFNNILTTALVAGEVASGHGVRDEDRQAAARDIEGAVERGKALTRALMNFSRPQAVTSDFDPFARLEDLRSILERLVGRNTEVRWAVTAPTGAGVRIVADGLQFDQLLLNLAANARDAMPNGGTLSVAARLTTDSAATSAETPLAGPCLELTVSDTGGGMSAEVMEHIFEPFYSTKPPGRGTGLGLSTAFGFVRHAGGRLHVSSAPGQGATFTILLPVRDVGA